MPGLLVTGTDTGVGKTTVACALVIAARRAGLDVGAMKPVESGCARGPSGLVPADAERLRLAAGGEDPPELVCPFRLEAPLAPGIAAVREQVDVTLEEIGRCHRELSARHPGGIVVEGAGGLLVPIEPGFATVADLAIFLSLPALVVARAGLGTINHTVLTVEALSARGIECRGVLLAGAPDGSTDTNAAAIERLADVPVLGVIPQLQGSTENDRVAMLVHGFAQLLERGRKSSISALLE